jgi:DNA-binding IclR family transcriptional regulator
LLETLRESSYVSRVEGGSASSCRSKCGTSERRSPRAWISRRWASPYLKELRDETHETARLTVLHGEQGICIAQVETELPMRIQTPIGGTLLLYCSATGKAMLAFQSKEFIDSIASSMQRFTSATAGSRKDLLAELDQIRRDGFAINCGERVIGVCGVGAPVANIGGDIRAAIGISGPAERLNQQVLRKYGPLVRDVACRLSHDLGAPRG